MGLPHTPAASVPHADWLLLVLGPHLSITGTKHRPALGNADASGPRQGWNSPSLMRSQIDMEDEGWLRGWQPVPII